MTQEYLYNYINIHRTRGKAIIGMALRAITRIIKTSVYREKQVYIEKKTSLYLLCDDYVLSIADGTSVSTFLCTPGA